MKTKTTIFIGIFLIFFLLIPVCNGSTVEISKNISKKNIKVNETLTVKITIENKGQEEVNGTVIDFYPKFAEVLYANTSKDSFAPVIKWNISLDSGKSSKHYYKLNFDTMPNTPSGFKNVTIPRTIFKYDNREVESGSSWVNVSNISKTRNCNYNFECEPKQGENSDNCIQDCPVSGRDKHCDKLEDSICDPDCREKDPDCPEFKNTSTSTTIRGEETEVKKAICGNGECEKNENQRNCPEDCKTGFPYYLLWFVIILFILAITIVIIYKSKKASVESHD